MAVNEKTLTFYFIPKEVKSYSGNANVTTPDYTSNTDFDYALSGNGFIENFDVLMQGGETWDLISYLFFDGLTNQILKLWQDNKHLSDSDKRNFAVSGDMPLLRVALTTEELEEQNENENINNLPPWKQ